MGVEGFHKPGPVPEGRRHPGRPIVSAPENSKMALGNANRPVGASKVGYILEMDRYTFYQKLEQLELWRSEFDASAQASVKSRGSDPSSGPAPGLVPFLLFLPLAFFFFFFFFPSLGFTLSTLLPTYILPPL